MEYILFGTIVVLLIERQLTNRSQAKEREDLIRALLSKDVKDYSTSKAIEHETESVEPPKPEFVPLEDLPHDKFMNTIHGQ